MVPPNVRLADLSDDDRLALESWLAEFDQSWAEGLLQSRVEQIPTGRSWRVPALAEMVKIDLERQWQNGRQVRLESYLKEFPELGTPADVAADLIHAEYEVRRQSGAPAELEDYLRRFPNQAAELAQWIARGGSAPSRRSSSGSGDRDTDWKPGAIRQELPEQFGRYRIIKRLGQGGMGSVYLAEDTQLQRRVALKVANSKDAARDGSDARIRLLTEARAAATLDHPYLCPVHDADEIDGLVYLTMAYIDGQSLAQSIRGTGLPIRQVAALVGKLAVALQEAHAKGVIHRDLKPANIMIKSTGRGREPVIVDFGLARRNMPNEERLTRTGQIMGTLDYMAPEQIRGDLNEIGPACDIYALGVILYELLTGRLPFEGSGLAVVGQILTQAPLPPSTFRSDLDPRLEAICLKAMAKVVADRYASMTELAAALTDFLRSPSPTSTSAQAASSPPASRAPRPTGSDTLVAQFLDQMATEKAAPASLPSQEPVLSPRTSSGRRRPPWVGRALAAGVMLLALIVAGVAGLFNIKSKDGVIILENLPVQAEVLLDGEKVSIPRPDGRGLAELRMPPGRRRLEVKQDGFLTFVEDLTVGTSERIRVRVRLAPLLASQPTEEHKEADAPPKPIAPKSPLPKHGPEEAPKTITNSVNMKLVLIPAGEFLMGSPNSDKDAVDNEKPQHGVRINRPFYMGATEVTQEQYRAVTGQNPSQFTGSDDLPVEKVSWDAAIVFCNALSAREGLKPYYPSSGGAPAGGDGYRLPTEAEWEYACRAGSSTRFSFGDDAERMDEFGWHRANSEGRTHPVGQKQPNVWGLYDMHGNVWEWCGDGYDAKSDGQTPGANSLGPRQAEVRVFRGGGWGVAPQRCRAAIRRRNAQGFLGYGLGFRVARGQSEVSPVPLRSPVVIADPTAQPIRDQPAPPVPGPVTKPTPAPKAAPKTITNSVKMKLVLIPAGEFLMGSPDSDAVAASDEKPQHRVRIMRPFYMGAYLVTQGQYRAVTGKNPSHFKGSNDLPVDTVSWYEAIAFCNTLSVREGLKPYEPSGREAPWGGGGYRLPTEEQWEYACRAGSTTRYGFGDNEARLGAFGWYKANSAGRTQPVGQKRPNAWGLYDMHGQVWEWCWDWYGEKYYGGSPGADSPGPSRGTVRVNRGGSWSAPWEDNRSADRNWGPPDFRNTNLGFRVVRVPSEASPVPPPGPEVTVNPPAPPIAKEKPVPTARVTDAQPTPALNEAPKTITNSVKMKLVLIPAGEFLMGAPDSDKDAFEREKPQQRVRISRPFYLGAYEVTQGQYQAVAGKNPSQFKGSDDLPVDTVSWHDAITFCNTLRTREGLKPYYPSDGKTQSGGDGYRLPTEPQWEYACRAGSTTRYCFGDDVANLGEFGWYGLNSSDKTHPVGQKRPNAWGLYDMHGNVGELCWDLYDARFQGQSRDTRPLDPSQATDRVRRGGSWYNNTRYCRAASRYWNAPDFRDDHLGFRVARDPMATRRSN